MPVPDWAQMGLTVFGPGELNHLAPKLRMDSRDIRFPFGHSRPCQLTPLLACASSKTSAPLPTGGAFFLSAIELQCWIALPSSCSLPAPDADGRVCCAVPNAASGMPILWLRRMTLGNCAACYCLPPFPWPWSPSSSLCLTWPRISPAGNLTVWTLA